MRRFHLFACALSATVAMAAPARADDDKALRFVPHADLTIIDPYFSGVYDVWPRIVGLATVPVPSIDIYGLTLNTARSAPLIHGHLNGWNRRNRAHGRRH